MAELTQKEMDKMMEMFRLMMDKMTENMDEERRERREYNKSIREKLDEIRNNTKLWREELRNERTKGIKMVANQKQKKYKRKKQRNK